MLTSERPSTSVQLSSMTPEEARLRTESIKTSVNVIREHLVQMFMRRGWEALGYKSWHEYLLVEFPDTNHTYLRRQTNAGLLESDMGIEVGLVKESHLRPILETLGGEDTAVQKLAYSNTLWNNPDPTAKDFLVSARTLYVLSRSTDRLAERMTNGELSVNSAYEITKFIETRCTNDIDLAIVAQECSDVELLVVLEKVKEAGLATWDEIFATGHVPSFPEPLPLARATAETLISWLSVASAEHRAQAGVEGREERDKLWEAIETLLNMIDTTTDVSVIRNAAIMVRSMLAKRHERYSN